MNHDKFENTSAEEYKSTVQEETDGCTQGTPVSDAKSAVRTLAAFYLIYLIYQLCKEIHDRNVSDYVILMLIAAIILFVIGVIWLIWPEAKRIKEVLDSDEHQ